MVAFVSCEDSLSPVFGVFNFYATLTSVPLMAVPLRPLLYASTTSMSAPLLTWLAAMTFLFCCNLHMHYYGPSNTLPEVVGNQLVFGTMLQAIFSAHNINALRLREGLFAARPTSALAATLLGVAVSLYATFIQPSHQQPMSDVVDLITGPFIIGTLGYLSRGDRVAWPFFLRSCIGLVVCLVVVAAEPHACRVDAIAPYYHAILCHATIWLLFGSVAWLAIHLEERSNKCTE